MGFNSVLKGLTGKPVPSTNTAETALSNVHERVNVQLKAAYFSHDNMQLHSTLNLKEITFCVFI
jgi:hypothetical protein